MRYFTAPRGFCPPRCRRSCAAHPPCGLKLRRGRPDRRARACRPPRQPLVSSSSMAVFTPVSDDDARAPCWRISTWANSFRCGDHGRYRKHQLLPLHLARRIRLDAVRGADARAAAVLYRADAPAGRTRHPGAAAADLRDGTRLTTLHGKPCAIVTRLPGGYEPAPGAAHCALAGATLARTHLAAQDFPIRQPNLRGLSWWKPPQGHALPGRRPGPPAVDGIGRAAGRQRHRVLAKPALGSGALRPVPR